MGITNTSPIIKQGWMRAVIFLLAFFACALLAAFMAGYVTVLTKSPASATVTISLFITAIFAILLTIVFTKTINRQPVNSLGFQWHGYQHHALTGICLGVALLGAGSLVLFATGNLEWNTIAFPVSDIFIALVLMGVIALAEELVFRGYILNNLMQSMHPWAALTCSAVLFAVAHISNPGITSVATVNLLLAGLLLGINYIYTRNLWFAILFHFSWNFFQGPVLGYEVSGLPLRSILQPELKGPWWLTGTSFGFEGSFIATCLFMGSLILFYTVYTAQYGKPVAATQ
jgi:CAAX protease family protein